MIRLSIKSDFAQMWRYNTTITCCGYSSEDEQLFAIAERDYRGEVLSEEIANRDEGCQLVAEAEECHHIRAIIYVVPNTLPLSRVVADNPPFDMSVEITTSGGEIYSRVHHINQWGGAAIEIKLEL